MFITNYIYYKDIIYFKNDLIMKNEEYIDKEYESLTDIQKEFLDKYLKIRTVNPTCDELGITYFKYCYWKRSDATFMKYKKLIDSAILDYVEGKLFELIEKNHFPSIKFFLEKRHHEYVDGEVELEVDSKRGTLVRFVNHNTKRVEEKEKKEKKSKDGND